MARKNVGLRYGEFEFPAEQGFTGSAGRQSVKGYQRGGRVKSPDKTKGKGKSTKGMPKNVKAKGGKVGYQAGGAVERPGHAEGPNPFNPQKSPAQYRLWESKHHIDPPPPAAEAPPADEGGGILGGLGRLFGRSERELEELGEAKGGRVKYGEGGYYGKPGDKYPTRKSGPAGKQGKSMPKNVKARGGKVRPPKGETGKAKHSSGEAGARRKASGKGMPPQVKAGGGAVHDKLYAAGGKMGYAKGGYAAAKNTSGEFKQKTGPQDTMDTGVQPARRGGNARNSAEKEAGGTGRLKPGLKHGGRVAAKAAAESKHVAKATKVPKPTRAAKGGYAAGDKKTHDTSRGRTPYKGYNKQPGGSGNKDSRYMKGSTRGR